MSIPPEFISQFSDVATPVGFSSLATPPSIGQVTPPDGMLAAENRFAVVATVPCAAKNADGVNSLAQHAQRWMLERLLQQERQGKLMDGYLLVLLDNAPEDDVMRTIKELSVDTEVCRKHVLWADGQRWTERLWAVTVLGLPTVAKVEKAQITIPSLPRNAQLALQLYSQHGNYDAVAETLRDQAKKAALSSNPNAD